MKTNRKPNNKNYMIALADYSTYLSNIHHHVNLQYHDKTSNVGEN